MPGKVIFKVLSGASAGKEFTYDGKEQLFVGRHEDCGILLPDKLVSRRHCMMEITPPEVKVRDFGSLNGTFLNGKKIGQRDKDLNPEDVEHIQYQEFDLADGDVLGISRQCEIGVKIVEFQRCAQCGKEIDGQTVDGEDNNICADCQNDPLKLLAAILAQLGAKPGVSKQNPPGSCRWS